MNHARQGMGVLEVIGLGPTLVILDALDKAANIRLLQAELNDYYGVCVKILGDPASLRAAIDAAERIADQMRVACVTAILDAPDPRAWPAIESPREYNPLIQADVVFVPAEPATGRKEPTMSPSPNYAIGLIETQGFTAVIDAIDTACKAANVEVIGKEKLGGGYVTVLIKGDVAAVEAAVAAGRARVDPLGKLIAAHIIARPSAAVLSLLPK